MTHPPLSCSSVFCELIRSEAGGLTSLVGIYPDRIELKRSASASELPQNARPILDTLAIYSRFRLPLDRPVAGPIEGLLLSPSGQPIFVNVVEKSFIEEHFEEAKRKGNEFVTVLQEMEGKNFPVVEDGRFRSIARYGGEEYFSGAVELVMIT